MPLTCIIVDDEPLAVKLMESFVAKTPGLELLASFTDSVEAINAVKEQKPNLLFLDIQMPDLNGMELAHMIPTETRVIFTTAFKEYAFESYEVSALDFLLKPIRYNKFMVAVEKAKDWFAKSESPKPQPSPHLALPLGSPKNTQTPSALFVRVDGELRNITINDIIYVNGMKDYVMFYLDSEAKPLITHLTMKAVEEMLPPERFLRVHRSYIIAVDKIRKVDRNDCIYIGNEIIHVPDGYQESFHNFLGTRTINKM